MMRGRMTTPDRARRLALAFGGPVLRAAALALLAGACSGEAKSASASGATPRTPCGPDEVREFTCDELLPRQSSKPALEPYEDCPAAVEDQGGEVAPTPRVASFDPDYTRHIRLRAPPGNACCYSRCSPLALVDPSTVRSDGGCGAVRAFREHWCAPTLESGSSEPASPPFDRCPVAVAPPRATSFSVPPGALLDPAYTSQRRSQGFDECCYSWCSQHPVGIPIE